MTQTLTPPYAPNNPRTVKTRNGRKTVPRRMTPGEFLKFDWPEMERWELINGRPVMSPSPQWSHQSLVVALVQLFKDWCDKNQDFEVISDMDLLLPKAASVVRPDLMVVAASDARKQRDGPFKAIPKLVVEVASPSTVANDLGAKRDVLAVAGLAEYWTADPISGGLSIWTEPLKGEFKQLLVDTSGFVRSPLLVRRVRVMVDGNKHQILLQ